MELAANLREFEPIEVRHAAEAESGGNPQQVIAAMPPVLPKILRHATAHPHRIDPLQVIRVADRRVVNGFQWEP